MLGAWNSHWCPTTPWNDSESLISIFVFHTSSFEEGVRRGQAVVPDSGRCDCFYQDFVDNAQQLTFLYSLILPLVVFDSAFEVVGNQMIKILVACISCSRSLLFREPIACRSLLNRRNRLMLDQLPDLLSTMSSLRDHNWQLLVTYSPDLLFQSCTKTATTLFCNMLAPSHPLGQWGKNGCRQSPIFLLARTIELLG